MIQGELNLQFQLFNFHIWPEQGQKIYAVLVWLLQ